MEPVLLVLNAGGIRRNDPSRASISGTRADKARGLSQSRTVLPPAFPLKVYIDSRPRPTGCTEGFSGSWTSWNGSGCSKFQGSRTLSQASRSEYLRRTIHGLLVNGCWVLYIVKSWRRHRGPPRLFGQFWLNNICLNICLIQAWFRSKNT